jgi:hypothetical protein
MKLLWKVYLFWSAMIALLAGCLWLRNRNLYRLRSIKFVLAKTAADAVLIVLLAAKLPVMLVVWVVTWLTRPLQNPYLRAAIAVAASWTLAGVTTAAFELIVLGAIFAIDDITGGIMKKWHESGRQTPAAEEAA